MDPVDVRPCSVADLIAAPNIADLQAEYAQECAIAELRPHQAQWDTYSKLEQAGILHVLGAYLGQEMIGFLLLMVSTNPHFGRPLAVSESFFVASEHRKSGAGIRMLHMAEEMARRVGAEGIFVSAPVDSRLERVLPSCGYRETTRAFFRSLPCSPQ